MGLEAATYINDLVPTNPLLGDPVNAGDDHIRLLKQAIKNSFPNIAGAMNASHTELNYAIGVTSGIQAQLDAKSPAVHTHTETEITDGGIFPRNAATEDITGQWTFSALATFNGGIKTDDILQQITGGAGEFRRLMVNLDWNAEQRKWVELFGPSSWGMYATDDAYSLSRAVVVANRNGYAITNIAYGNATDNPQHYFYGMMFGMTGLLELQGAEPAVRMYENDAAVNEKRWRFVAAEGNFYLQALLDDLSGGATPITMTRSGATIDQISFVGTAINFTCASLQVNGNTIWHSSNDGAGSGLDADLLDGQHASAFAPAQTANSFTISLHETSPGGAVIATTTAYWKKNGSIVTLRFPAIWGMSTATIFYLTDLPTEIRPATGIAHPFAAICVENGVLLTGYAIVDEYGRITLGAFSPGFSGSSFNKGLNYGATLTYPVN